MTESRSSYETILKGIPAAPGIGIGPVFVFRRQEPIILERRILPDEVDREVERLTMALERSRKELRKVLDFAEQKLGPAKAKIFEAQVMILDDFVLFESINKRIRRELKNVEFVVQDEIGKYHRIMMSSKDEYARERANDLDDVRGRILRNLQEQKLISKFEGSHVIVSHSLSAADTLLFSRNEVLGYVTEVGGSTSHMAILARALKIPTVVGVHQVTSAATHGSTIIVDGYNGLVICNPTDSTVKGYRKTRSEHEAFEETLSPLRDLPAETLDGHRVNLSANVELEQELEFVKSQGADGVGLFRSESILIGKEVFPSEGEQVEHYRRFVDAVAPRKIIIRTFDIGGDKMMVQSLKENNPYLGWRGIRVMLDKPEIFLDQLRAILRVSGSKNVAIMFPMVSNLKEIRLAKQLLAEAKDQLRTKKVHFDEHIPIGVMIEVPAAAIIADDIAREVNFLSIGTNDLIQYLLAVDRTNDIVSELYQEFHPAVVRFLRRIIDRGKEAKVWVGMCGEMAGDPQATMLLLGLGLEEFSVVPNILPEIKKIIRSVHYTEAKHIADKVLTMETEDDIKSYLHTIMKQKFPEMPLGK